MNSDFVLPRNNEAEFIEIASKLDIKKLHFLYDFDNYDKEKPAKKIDLINQYKDVSVEIGFLVNHRNFSKSSKQSRIIVAKGSDRNRMLIESGKIRMIYGFEELQRKDYLHQRASGLNHVLCDLAKKNNVTIGFSYSSLFNKNSSVSSLIMGRMIQNISLCRKYKVKTVIGSFSAYPYELRAPHDTSSIFKIFGMEIGKEL